MAYWNDEDPEVIRIAGMELRYYAKAGKLQIYQVDPARAHGVTKGVVISVAEQQPEELAGLVVAIESFLFDSVSEMITQDRWNELLEEKSEVQQ